jgi:hypothetical protein
MTVKIIPNDKGNPPGKLADAELHFQSGSLEGLKLIGFAIWERRTGGGRNVTFPARQYSVNGEGLEFRAAPSCARQWRGPGADQDFDSRSVCEAGDRSLPGGALMVVEVDVIIIRPFPSLYHFHLVTPAARKWVKKNVKEHHDKAVKVMEVERKFAWDIAYGMDCEGLRITSDTKAVLP